MDLKQRLAEERERRILYRMKGLNMFIETMRRSMEIFETYDPAAIIQFFDGCLYVPISVREEHHQQELRNYGWEPIRVPPFNWIAWKLLLKD